MSFNKRMEALVESNYKTKPVNVSNFANPFLLLSSTKALNIIATQKKTSTRADSKIGVDRSSSTTAQTPAPSPAPAPAPTPAPSTAPTPATTEADAVAATIAEEEGQLTDYEDTISAATRHPPLTDSDAATHRNERDEHPDNAHGNLRNSLFTRANGLGWAYEVYSQRFIMNYRQDHDESNPTILQFLNKRQQMASISDKIYKGKNLGGHAYVIEKPNGDVSVIVIRPNGTSRSNYTLSAGDARITNIKGMSLYP